MPISCTAEPERGPWDAFVAGHPTGHLLQSFGWGELKAAFGWEALRLAVLDGGQFRAAAQVLFRRFAGVCMAYVPRGPVVDWEDQAAMELLLEAIAQAGRARRAIFLKIEPNLPDEEAGHARLRALGFRPATAIQPRSTVVVDLRPDEEALLALMKLKTRYNVRLAGRRGVTVRPAGGPEEVALFYDILRETSQRHGFSIHTLVYYQAAYQLLNEGERGTILFAEREGQVLAAHWVSTFGQEAVNLYGASRNEGQKHRPTYLLQWEVMRWARAHGCTRYDLWGGIPEGYTQQQAEEDEQPEEKELEGLAGVAAFKLGFCGRLGRVVRWVGAYDRPYWPWAYWLYQRLLERA